MEKTWIGCAPRNFHRGRFNGAKPEAIVVHIVVGSLQSCDHTFLDNALGDRRSAHYCVGKDGRIHQYVAEEDTAYHAGKVVDAKAPFVNETKKDISPNVYAIGIEHEGFPDDPWPETQIETSARLIADIAARWNIAVDPEHVIMHRDIKATKTCPGFGVNIKTLVDRAAQIRAQGGAPVAPGMDAAPKPVTDGFPRSTRITRAVRLRSGRPSTSAPVVSVLPIGSQVTVSKLVPGEPVQNGTPWWCEVGGGSSFFWAGASDVVVPA